MLCICDILRGGGEGDVLVGTLLSGFFGGVCRGRGELVYFCYALFFSVPFLPIYCLIKFGHLPYGIFDDVKCG